MHRHAFDLDRLADLVAGRTGNRRDDRQLGPRQCVEQRTLADVGLASQHDLDALAQQCALARAGQHAGHIGHRRIEPTAGVCLFEEVDLLFGEVERRLHQHAQLDQAIAQRVDLARKRSGQRAARRARGSFGAGFDQVAHGLGLGQVDLVVQERTLGELTGFGQPQADLAAGVEATRQQELQHHRAAVRLQFEHRFAGVGMRRREVDRQTMVDGLFVAAEKRQVGGVARHEWAATNCGDQRSEVTPRGANDANGTTAGRGGHSDDGVLVTGQHGAILAQAPWRCMARGEGPPVRVDWTKAPPEPARQSNGTGGEDGRRAVRSLRRVCPALIVEAFVEPGVRILAASV